MSEVERLNATAEFRRALMQAPYHQWLGVELTELREDGVAIALHWREEFVSNIKVGATHGGILAALIDLTGLYAIRAAGGSVAATADLRVDYHRPAVGGTVLAIGTVLKVGRRMSTADVRVIDGEQVLLASGRGAYLAQ
ncbi:PaaI family thioesterase [Bradyrhizobium tropiciagri]|uniref:PaaI family thioesterase n=1 Tax=Bradyrhizobium tropiciagri TaxID=312253 RepID=UPI001BA76F5B|nr:PaaI family thioesterase [Bradyrhizobium tropiciagri]MBR0900108.1 PaaI family thioesterase [Bradyrhizobium tropiciagri]